MAVIRNKNVKVNGVIAGADAVSNIEYNVDFDLITKQLNKQSNFPTVVAGDNNSVVLTFRTPKAYNGVDLTKDSVNCVVNYTTTWEDEVTKAPSSGQIELSKYMEEDEEFLYYSWVLDINQTKMAGECLFSLSFLKNLEEDPYINNVQIGTQAVDNAIAFTKQSLAQTQLKYWIVSSLSSSFTIQDSTNNLNKELTTIMPTNTEQRLIEIEDEINRLDKDIDNAKNSISERAKITFGNEKILNESTGKETIWQVEINEDSKIMKAWCEGQADIVNEWILEFRATIPRYNQIKRTSPIIVMPSLKSPRGIDQNSESEMNRTIKWSLGQVEDTGVDGDVRIFVQDINGPFTSSSIAEVQVLIIANLL